jgi:succinylglutamate desuccinylase
MKEIWNKIYLLDSGKKWSITTIMVWVHWNEFSWPKAVDEILLNFKIDTWKVYFVYANLEAMKINKRFYEKNMNRCFLKNNNGKTYEEKRAKQIIEILDQSDYLLDVHNTIGEENSIPFLISEYKEFWKYFDVKYVVSGFDNLHPGGSDSYMNSIWKKWFCIECGSVNVEIEEKLVSFAEKSILNFLKITKNINKNPEIFNNQKYIKFGFIYKNNSLDFEFTKKYKDFEKIKKWETIVFDWQIEFKTNKDCYILFSYTPNNLQGECFCLGKII